MNESGRNWPARLGAPPETGLQPGHAATRHRYRQLHDGSAAGPIEVAEQPEQREICHRGQRERAEAIPEFAAWLDGLAGRLVAVAKPAAFDHGFVAWYLWRFAGRNPLGHRCLDIRSCAAGLVRSPVYSLAQAELEEIAGPIDRRGVRAHVAVDDALEQGRLFVGLLYRARSERVARGRFRLVRSLLGHLALRSGSPPLEL